MRRKATATSESELSRQRGFNGEGATVTLVLVDAAVGKVAAAVKRIARCTQLRKDAYGKRVRASKQSYIVYRLAGHRWTMVQSASGPAATFELARKVSQQIRRRAIWLALSDVASWTGYYFFDSGVLTEILEDFGEHHGTAAHLPADMIGSLKVQPTGRGIFASSKRNASLSKLKTGTGAVKFIDDLFRKEEIFAPVSGEWDQEAGPRTLTLVDVDREDIERLDFLGGGALPAPSLENMSATDRLATLERDHPHERPKRSDRMIWNPSRRRRPYYPPGVESLFRDNQ